MKERHAALLDYVMQNGKTEVNTLAELLQTSKVTVRKDLDYLSERGLLKRERGYAVPNDPSTMRPSRESPAKPLLTFRMARR